MLAENLLNDIGFSDDEQKKYFEYKKISGAEIPEYAQAYMNGNIAFNDALEKIRESNKYRMPQYTADLLFLLECSGFLLEKYREKGIDKEIFITTMKDIKYKLDECKNVKNEFGIFVMWWYEGFLTMDRIAMGRLQYDIQKYDGESVTVRGHEINKGDFILNCHIPSAGPLTPELCLDSFKKAYEFFKARLKGGILPIKCHSWLLYPPYKEVFGANTVRFAQNYEIISVTHKEVFSDAWRVFGVSFDGNADKLPAETSLQRRFIEHIKSGKSFGDAMGFVLFDGEVVLTRS